jgi:hypothetical protein
MRQAWAKRLDQSQLLEYFAQYRPIPVDWLNWVSYFYGFDDNLFSNNKDFPGIRWLEEHQLASYSVFIEWLNGFLIGDQDENVT